MNNYYYVAAVWPGGGTERCEQCLAHVVHEDERVLPDEQEVDGRQHDEAVDEETHQYRQDVPA